MRHVIGAVLAAAAFIVTGLGVGVRRRRRPQPRTGRRAPWRHDRRRDRQPAGRLHDRALRRQRRPPAHDLRGAGRVRRVRRQARPGALPHRDPGLVPRPRPAQEGHRLRERPVPDRRTASLGGRCTRGRISPWRPDRSTACGAGAGTSLRARIAPAGSPSAGRSPSARSPPASPGCIAADLLGHQTPFFAPIAAVVSLGTSYGQRLRRVVEVTIGVAIGVFVGDLIVAWLGTGVVAAHADRRRWRCRRRSCSTAGQLFVTQAAVQSIVVSTLLPDPGAGLTRWTDALVGGAVALVAATAVPAAPLRRPREQAAVVMRKIAGAAAGGRRGDGRRRGGPGAGAAGRRPVDRPPDPRAAGRRGRGAGGGGVVARSGCGTRATCGGWSSWSTRWTGRCAAPGCWCGRRRWRPTTGARCRRPTRCSRSTSPTPRTRWPTSWPPTGWRSAPGRRCWRSGTRPGWWSGPTSSPPRWCSRSSGRSWSTCCCSPGMDQMESTDALPPPPR